jgi:hypothetical protein
MVGLNVVKSKMRKNTEKQIAKNGRMLRFVFFIAISFLFC